MTISRRKKYIESLGVRKDRLAKVVGISVPLFSQYINGARPMPKHIEDKLDPLLKKIQEALEPLGLI